jgi:hypothetical protein
VSNRLTHPLFPYFILVNAIPAATTHLPTPGRMHTHTRSTSGDAATETSSSSLSATTEIRSSIFRATSAIETSETGSSIPSDSVPLPNYGRGTDLYAFPQDGQSLPSSTIYSIPGDKGGGKAVGDDDGEYHGRPEPMFSSSSSSPMRQMEFAPEFRPVALELPSSPVPIPSFPASQAYSALPEIEEDVHDTVRELSPCMDCLAGHKPIFFAYNCTAYA